MHRRRGRRPINLIIDNAVQFFDIRDLPVAVSGEPDAAFDVTVTWASQSEIVSVVDDQRNVMLQS